MNPSIISIVEDTAECLEKWNMYAELGRKSVPGLRTQQHEEAGRWVYVVAKGWATQEDFDNEIEQWRKEGRIG
jgi:hypothetical protein